MREAEGDVLISLACDMLDAGGSSINREALGLFRGGLTMRLGLVALAPWEEALRRAPIAIGGALLAIACGPAVAWWRELAYPGEGWMAVLTAPALVVTGQLAGRRAPIACGALLLLVLGVAQGNSQLAVPLSSGSIDWGLHGSGWQVGAAGMDLPLYSCALPGSLLLLLASAAHPRRPVPRSVELTTVAWVIAGALGVSLALEGTAALNPAGTLLLGDVRLNGLGLCIVAASVAAIAAMAVRFARRQRDPSGMLAAALTVAAILPVACLYVFSALLLEEAQVLLALAASAITIVLAMLKLARLSTVAT